ncbi:hypothetical protein VTJ04DRAFT_4489 [Mycothermus thermophilus]|uniref:uncharacterized protein n=1 Tax=Humicola insolens TaxID=85995 RepID=UPI00374243C9
MVVPYFNYCWSVCLTYRCGCQYTTRTVHRCTPTRDDCWRWMTYKSIERDCIDHRDADVWGLNTPSSAARQRIVDSEAFMLVSETEVQAEAARALGGNKSVVASRREEKSETSSESSSSFYSGLVEEGGSNCRRKKGEGLGGENVSSGDSQGSEPGRTAGTGKAETARRRRVVGEGWGTELGWEGSGAARRRVQ